MFPTATKLHITETRLQSGLKDIKDKNITYHRYTQNKTFDSDIILIDKMGELNNIYAISDIAILGGAFKPDVGVHNPLEPAFFGCKVISGETIFNQKSLFECLDTYYLKDSDDLRNKLDNIKNLETSSLQKAGTIKPIVDYIQEIIQE